MSRIGDALRGFASVLNPAEQQAAMREDEQNRGLQNQAGMMMLQQRMQQQAQARQLAQQQQSPEYQMKMEALKNDRAFREEASQAGGDIYKISRAAAKYKPELAVSLLNQEQSRLSQMESRREALEQRAHEFEIQMADRSMNREAQDRIAARADETRRMIAAMNNNIAKGQMELKKMQLATDKNNPFNKPLPATDLGRYGKPGTGERPKPGMSLRDVIDGGYEYVSTAESNKASEAKGAYATIDRLDELVSKIWDPKDTSTGVWWRTKEGGKFLYQRAMQSNPDLSYLEAFAEGTLAPLIRAVGEKGNLATEDIERAYKLIPKTGSKGGLPDTPEVARGKMKQLREWFDRAQGRTPQADTPKPNSNIDDLLRKYGGS